MTKRCVLALVAVFVAWSVLDFLIHGVILQPIYESTASLWRPMQEMNMGLMSLVVAVSAVCFVGIYSWLVQPHTVVTGFKYGLLFGISAGFSMGFGSYVYMPIPLTLAASWFAGTLVEAVVAGLIVGALLKPAASTKS